MTRDAPPSRPGHGVLASCFVLSLVALLVWQLGVWQSASTAHRREGERSVSNTEFAGPADERELLEEPLAWVPRLQTEPASSGPPAVTPPLDALATGEPRELAVQQELDALTSSNPERALGLAREALASDPDSSLAPRRARSLVKALASLGRFHEARDEARRIVQRYRGTPEALDIERHLLVHPLDQPSREQMQAEASHGPAASVAQASSVRPNNSQ